MVEPFIADIRHGWRRLRDQPGFTWVAVLTLALGIGTSTAVFSAVKPMLFEPLPYPGADLIAMIWDRGPDAARVDVTFGTYRELSERARSFDGFAVMTSWQPVVTGRQDPARLEGQRVSAEYFRVLGVAPALGRDFTTSDDVLNGPPVVILSDGLWRRRFGGDTAIVGTQVVLDDDGHTVVGIMPPGFDNVLASSAEIWKPLQYDASLPPGGREWGHHLRMTGRRRADTELAQASRELEQIAHSPTAGFARPPWASLERGVLVVPLQREVTRDVRPALLAIFGAVVVLLTIACTNVTNLLLASGLRRQSEFAVRVALGARSSRLIRQLLTEGALLATLSAGLGILLALVGVRLLVGLSPAELPRASAIGLDGTAFLFAFGVTALVALIVGLFPAWHITRRDLQAGIREGSPRTSDRQVTRRALVVGQVALALVLLVSAGLLLRSTRRLFAVDPGFEPARVLTMQVHAAGHRFDEDSAAHRLFAEVLQAVRNVPGVVGAGLTSQLPISGDHDQYGVRFEQVPTPESEGASFRYTVSPGYAETMGIPLRRGRMLDTRDVAGAPPAVLINESFARRVFADQDPIGQRLHFGRTDLPPFTIVGVVGDVRQRSLADAPSDAVYVPGSQWYFTDRALWLVVRARADVPRLASSIREAIWSIDGDLPIVRVATMDDLVAASEAQRTFARVLFQCFALAALFLVALGIYGVVAGSVNDRFREIGVRSALGASRVRIVALVLRQGMVLAAIGIVIGWAGAAVSGRALDTLLFGVSPLDPLTNVGVVALLLGVAALACWVPALRAVRIDPAITLREG